MSKRGDIWLAVSGLVKSEDGNWLVVKKKYGGLKGKWSLPAGFVEKGETVDEAVVREVEEETGIRCRVKGLIGLRTGVIKDEISDNMIIFLLEAEGNQVIKVQESELYDVAFKDPYKLINEEDTSVLLKYILEIAESPVKPMQDGINPGNQFGYTAYKVFL